MSGTTISALVYSIWRLMGHKVRGGPQALNDKQQRPPPPPPPPPYFTCFLPCVPGVQDGNDYNYYWRLLTSPLVTTRKTGHQSV